MPPAAAPTPSPSVMSALRVGRRVARRWRSARDGTAARIALHRGRPLGCRDTGAARGGRDAQPVTESTEQIAY